MEPKPHTQPAGRARQRHLERERQVLALADRQHGVVARRQLEEVGFGAEAIKSRLRGGRLHAVHRGVYAVGHSRLTLRGNWLAALLACGDGALLSHHSAAALWGLMRPRWSPVDVTGPHGRTGRHGVRLHRSPVGEDERAVEARIPVTSPARTLLDLAEVVDEGRLRRAFEEADRLKLLHMPDLERVCARARRRRGLPALRRLIADAVEPTYTRSPLENRFADFCREHLSDLPEPLTNVTVLEKEVDAYWPHRRLAVEMDSWEFHGHRAAFERDRSRDSALQAAGYRVVRLTHRRLKADPATVAAELRQLLAGY